MVSKVGSEDYRVTMVWVDVEVLGRWYSKRRVCENLNDTATSKDQPKPSHNSSFDEPNPGGL